MSNRKSICWNCDKRDSCKTFNRDRDKVCVRCPKFEDKLLPGLIDLFQKNADFRTYVNKYRTKEGINIDEALSHHVVRDYAAYLKDRGEMEQVLPNLWKNDEDKGC